MISTSHRVFLEVATHLSFSKASRVLYISQPSVSRHISLLEKGYNCALFDRKGANVLLTPIGQKLYSLVLKAKDIENEINFEVSELKGKHEVFGTLRIGASTTVALYILPKILSGFHNQYLNIHIQLVNRNTENVLMALLDKKIDVAVVEAQQKLNSLDYTYFLADKVIPVCSAASTLASTPTLAPERLRQLPVALREVGSGTLSSLEASLAGKGLSVSMLNAKVRLGGTEALKNFIREDPSVGFLPEIAVSKELASGEFVELEIPGLEIRRQFFFVTRKSENYQLIKTFVRYAKDFMQAEVIQPTNQD